MTYRVTGEGAPARPFLFRIYAAFAIAGAVFPYAIFIPWLAEHGFAPGLFVRQLFGTPPSAIFASDVLYSAAIFILFVVVEGRRLGMRRLWVPPLLALTVGLCCAFPAFLAMRERALSR